MTSYPAPICLGCKHLGEDRREPNGDYTPVCAAFPAGIPDAIWHSAADHRLAYPGDRGMRFAPKARDDAEYADFLFRGRGKSGGDAGKDD